MGENKNCANCKSELTRNNIARWNIPGTYNYQTIRTDSSGKNWRQKCTDEHDSIDWDE